MQFQLIPRGMIVPIIGHPEAFACEHETSRCYATRVYLHDFETPTPYNTVLFDNWRVAFAACFARRARLDSVSSIYMHAASGISRIIRNTGVRVLPCRAAAAHHQTNDGDYLSVCQSSYSTTMIVLGTTVSPTPVSTKLHWQRGGAR